jgi:hypothetical protein
LVGAFVSAKNNNDVIGFYIHVLNKGDTEPMRQYVGVFIEYGVKGYDVHLNNGENIETEL